MVVLCVCCTGNALATQTLFIALDTIFEASLASMKKLKLWPASLKIGGTNAHFQVVHTRVLNLLCGTWELEPLFHTMDTFGTQLISL